MTRQGRHVRPGLRRVAIIALVVLIPITAWSLWDYIEARRLARTVAEIEARNEPIHTLSRRITYDGRPDNAARYYDAAGALLHRDALGGIVRDLRYGTVERAPVMSRARKWLEQNHEAERLLDRGTDMAFLGFQPGSEYSYRMDRLVALSSLAAIRALERLDGQDADGAARAYVAQLKLARAMRAASRTRRMVANFELFPLSDIAAVIGAGPSATALESLQAGLREYDDDDMVEDSALHMRAWLLEDVWDPASDWHGRPAVRFGANPLAPLAFFAMRPWLTHRVNAEIRVMTDLVEAARRPWPDRLKTGAYPEPPRPLAPGGFRIDYAVNAIRYLHVGQVDSIGRMLALVRTATTAIAIERFRRAHGGALPAALDELVPAFLTSVPLDPYSGAAVNYRKSADGYAVYSVGLNGKDDGGESLQPSARWGGAGGDRTRDGKDLGVQVKHTKGDEP